MLRKIKDKVAVGFSHMTLAPLENIEFVLALVLSVLASAILLPTGGAVYGSFAGKVIFSLLLYIPSLPLIYYRFKLNFKEYLNIARKRKKMLFFLSTGYTYLMVLSLIIQGIWPPHWIIYLGLCCIAWICYFRLGR